MMCSTVSQPPPQFLQAPRPLAASLRCMRRARIDDGRLVLVVLA